MGSSPDPLRFCPDKSVTRAQMATFLARALGLVELPTPIEEEPVAFPGAGVSVTAGRCCPSHDLVDEWITAARAAA